MNPFAFEYPESGFSKLSPLSKMAFLVAVSTCAMRCGAPALAILLVLGIVLHAAGRIGFGGSGRAALLVLWLGGFAAVARGAVPGDGRPFALETLPEAALYTLRLLAVLAFARLFFASTRVGELGDSLSRLARKLGAKRGALADPGILISLTLCFLPRTYDTYLRVQDAAALRSGRKAGKTPGMSLRVLGTFIVCSVRSALGTAQAMDLRGYSPGRTLPVTGYVRKSLILYVVSLGLIVLSAFRLL